MCLTGDQGRQGNVAVWEGGCQDYYVVVILLVTIGARRGWALGEGGREERVGARRGWAQGEGGREERVDARRGWTRGEGGHEERVDVRRGWA